MEELEKIQDLRFNLTEKMNDMMIELLITHQMLEDSLKEDSKMSDEERGLLYHHFEELKNSFSKEFKKNNKKEIKQYNELINK